MKKYFRAWAGVFVLTVLAGGCHPTYKAGMITEVLYDKIDIGMSRDEVKSVTGEPAFTGLVEGYEETVDGRRFYREKEAIAWMYYDSDRLCKYEIVIAAGKVVQKRVKW